MTDDWEDWDSSPVVESQPLTFKPHQPRNEFLQYSNSKYNNGMQNSGFSSNRNSEGNNWRSDGDRRPKGFKKSQNNVPNDNNILLMKVPSRFVGRIIGKGGSKISDLQFESGAKINVTKETEGDETFIKISGTEEDKIKAKELIIDLTVERKPRNPDRYQHVESSSRPSNSTADNSKPIDWSIVFQECERKEKEKLKTMAPIIKNFYVELPEISNMSETEVERLREANNNIVVKRTFAKENVRERSIPNPVTTFEQAFHNYPEILNEINKAGFEKPSPIQTQAWPILLKGEDMIGIAQTGTGKTLAFLLPALIHIDGQPVPREERTSPSVLILAPTRELAQQIDREVKKYFYRDIKSVCVFGGGDRREQMKITRAGVDIVIATPGRLNDLVDAGCINVTGITYVVLDEADRMLDMGFEPQIRKTLYDVRSDRQTVMTSATWPAGVRRLANSYMEDPIQVFVGSLDLAAVHSVTQTVLLISDNEDEKYNIFMEFISNMQPGDKVIVFCGKKARASHLTSDLIIKGIDCQSIHGDLEQSDREQALIDIKSGIVQILIATDVASRGIDIEDITHVINYDFPRNIEEYVHRVGRTGRAGREGDSISYFTRADWAQAGELIKILEEAQQYIPEELVDMSKRYDAWKKRKDEERKSGGGRGGQRYFGNQNRW